MKRESPRACPRCGSCDIVRAKRGSGDPWRCNRCGHQQRGAFPTVAALGTRPGVQTTNPEGSPKGMASGCFMVRPAGNKYS